MAGARTLVTALAFLVGTLAVEAQTPRPGTPGPAPSPLHLRIDAAALSGLPRRTISATDERGNTNSYTGVSLDELLVRGGAPTGAPVRGRAMLAYVLVGAADGYHVTFTLPELDPSFTDHVVLIAEARDGAPLAADVGPYRLIVPFDKREARWVRQVTSVDLQIAPIQ
jgi:hypothetical protein